MASDHVIRINLASIFLGDFNEDFLECFIHHGVQDVSKRLKDYSTMSTFSQRAYKTTIILAASVMRDEFRNYYDVMTNLIGREQCIGFMTPEKLDHLLDSIVNCEYGQIQIRDSMRYYDRWYKKNYLSPDDMKNLRMWFMRIAKMRRNYEQNGYIAPPSWCELRW